MIHPELFVGDNGTVAKSEVIAVGRLGKGEFEFILRNGERVVLFTKAEDYGDWDLEHQFRLWTRQVREGGQ